MSGNKQQNPNDVKMSESPSPSQVKVSRTTPATNATPASSSAAPRIETRVSGVPRTQEASAINPMQVMLGGLDLLQRTVNSLRDDNKKAKEDAQRESRTIWSQLDLIRNQISGHSTQGGASSVVPRKDKDKERLEQTPERQKPQGGVVTWAPGRRSPPK